MQWNKEQEQDVQRAMWIESWHSGSEFVAVVAFRPELDSWVWYACRVAKTRHYLQGTCYVPGRGYVEHPRDHCITGIVGDLETAQEQAEQAIETIHRMPDKGARLAPWSPSLGAEA